MSRANASDNIFFFHLRESDDDRRLYRRVDLGKQVGSLWFDLGVRRLRTSAEKSSGAIGGPQLLQAHIENEERAKKHSNLIKLVSACSGNTQQRNSKLTLKIFLGS